MPKKSRYPTYIRGISFCLKEHGVAFTLVELMLVMFIVGTLGGIAVPVYHRYIKKARMTKAIVEIYMLQKEITLYEMDNDGLPNTLNDIGHGNLPDPWGRPYQYLNFANIKGKGKMRKDRFVVPLNSDYDLYSMGEDGESLPPLTAKVSHDDVVRASDGAYIGLASEY